MRLESRSPPGGRITILVARASFEVRAGSPDAKGTGHYELTDNVIGSRNPTTSPTLAFASVSSVFKEQSTPRGAGHAEPQAVQLVSYSFHPSAYRRFRGD